MSEFNYNLSPKEYAEVVRYTINKIERYPKLFGKTLENYFDLLFPDELKNFIMRRELNQQGVLNKHRG